jgi:hypothetical protein
VVSKAKRKTPYWWEAIRAARAAGTFTSENIERALNWTTCACGQQDERIRKHTGYSDGRPEDGLLMGLGSAFYGAVVRHEPSRAARILGRIERRAAELLAESR